jgi:hypothetical protein
MVSSSSMTKTLLFSAMVFLYDSNRLHHPLYTIFTKIANRKISQNPPSNLGIKTDIRRLWNIPDHQQGIRCKAPRSND